MLQAALKKRLVYIQDKAAYSVPFGFASAYGAVKVDPLPYMPILGSSNSEAKMI